MAYQHRCIDETLDELLPELAAIALDGAKGVGKTATAERRCRTIVRLDDALRREAISADPELVLRGPCPALIDEWQLEPSTWDVVRRQVDRDPTGGQFMLTGSASPRPGVTAHSGAGRIVRLRMRPMSFAERGLCEPTVSLRALLSGRAPDVEGESDVDLTAYAEEIVRSGFPGIRRLTGRARQAQLDGYLRGVVDRDVPDQGRAVRRPDTLLAWLSAYAAATSTTTSYNKILDAATPGDADKPAKTTVIAYRDALTQLWLLDPVPGWVPSHSPLQRLQQAPKHHLADPALAARLLGATAGSLLEGQASTIGSASGGLLGRLFESLVTLSVRVYAQESDAMVGHLRSGNGDREVDLVIVRPDGRVLAIEVKLTATVKDPDTSHLHWLRERLGDRVIDTVVITTGPYAYRRADGVAVVPLALLGV